MDDLEREKDVLEHAYKLFYDELAICGCGEPGKAMKLVYDLLKLAPFYVDGNYAKAESQPGLTIGRDTP